MKIKKLCFCVGLITEKLVRQKGYLNTISAGGNVNALKNIILNSDFDKNKKIGYFVRLYFYGFRFRSKEGRISHR